MPQKKRLTKEEQLGNYVFGKLPPQATELEEAVVGALMLDKDTAPIVLTTLKDFNFYNKNLATVFQSIERLSTANSPVDILTVMTNLKERGKLDEIGGPDYLAGLTDKVASAANIEYHARIIVQKWMKRQSIEVATQLIQNCYLDGDIFETLEEFETGFSDVTNLTVSGVIKIGRAIPKMLERAKLIADNQSEIIGVNASGIVEHEKQHGGASPGDLIIVSSDTGGGKSSYFNNILINSTIEKFPVFSWSGELTYEQQIIRMFAATTGLQSGEIRGGQFYHNADKKALVDMAANTFKDESVFFDSSTMTLQKMIATITNLHRTEGIKVFLFDRLELFDFGNTRNLDEAKGGFTSKMRGLANQLGITIYLAVQLRKSFMDNPLKIPMKVDLKGSGAIKDDATKILFFYRAELYKFLEWPDGTPTEGEGEIIIAKNTHGAEGTVRVKFLKTQTVWGVDFMMDPNNPILKANQPGEVKSKDENFWDNPNGEPETAWEDHRPDSTEIIPF